MLDCGGKFSKKTLPEKGWSNATKAFDCLKSAAGGSGFLGECGRRFGNKTLPENKPSVEVLLQARQVCVGVRAMCQRDGALRRGWI